MNDKELKQLRNLVDLHSLYLSRRELKRCDTTLYAIKKLIQEKQEKLK